MSGDPRFHALLKEIGDLHDKKQKDYGVETDPFANVRGSSNWGVKPWVGAVVRANDKIKRLQKYAQDGQLANESARDSFMDLAVYALIALVLHDEDQGKVVPPHETGYPYQAGCYCVEPRLIYTPGRLHDKKCPLYFVPKWQGCLGEDCPCGECGEDKCCAGEYDPEFDSPVA